MSYWKNNLKILKPGTWEQTYPFKNEIFFKILRIRYKIKLARLDQSIKNHIQPRRYKIGISIYVHIIISLKSDFFSINTLKLNIMPSKIQVRKSNFGFFKCCKTSSKKFYALIKNWFRLEKLKKILMPSISLFKREKILYVS